MVLPGGQVQRRQAVGGQRVDGSTVKQQEMCQILSEKHPVVEGETSGVVGGKQQVENVQVSRIETPYTPFGISIGHPLTKGPEQVEQT